MNIKIEYDVEEERIVFNDIDDFDETGRLYLRVTRKGREYYIKHDSIINFTVEKENKE